MTEKKSPLFTAAAREKQGMEKFAHPLNRERSQMRGVSLSEHTGLQRTGVHLMLLPPHKESFVYHTHAFEEEWLFVLSGRGRLEIDGQMHELGPGDFAGFSTPSAAHQVSNPYDAELTYLTGGERRDFELAEFPRLGKVMVRRGPDALLYPKDAEISFRALIEGEKEKK